MRRIRHIEAHCVDATQKLPRAATTIAFLFLCSCLPSAQAFAQSAPHPSAAVQTPAPVHQHGAMPAAEAPSASAGAEKAEPAKRPGAVTIGSLQVVIPDLIVLDQDGKERRFYSDLIKEKVVVLSFFFTSCVSTCPAMNLSLSKLQTNLADRLGKDVFIVTVSKDPETDTPQRLKTWGNALGVKPGWTMVTGDTKAIGKIVKDFTGDRLGKDSHNSIFLIGSDRTGIWTDMSGYTTSKELRQQLDALLQPAH